MGLLHSHPRLIASKRVRDRIQKEESPNNAKEQRVLKVSTYSALILAIFGITFGSIVSSSAVVFDGFVALISVGLGFLSVITSRYIYKEDDDVFQYGYVRFEPMVNLFKSLVLIVVCVYAFITGIGSIISGGYEIVLGGAMIYTFVALLYSFSLSTYTHFYSKQLDSGLIKVDQTEWLIDCVLYGGSAITFGVIYLLDPQQENPYSHFLDPALLTVLSLFLSVSPIKIAIANFKDLMMVAPKELDDKITEIMEILSEEHQFGDYDTHVAKSGRFYIVEVNILMDKNFQVSSVAELDNLREYICSALQIPAYKIWLSVSFTADPKWL